MRDDLPATARRLRIAVLNRQFSSTGGGAERYSIALVEQLAARHELHVFAQHIDHHWPGVHYHRVAKPLDRPRWLNQLWFAAATWWATRRGFDLVHSHENTWHGQVQTVHVLPVRYNLLHGLAGVRLAMRWLKIATSPRLLVYLALERCRFSLRQPRALVATSATLRDQVLQAYPASQPCLRVVTPGVEAVPGRCSAPQQAAARAALGLPASGFGLLFVGNDYRKKGLDTLLEALARLPTDCFLAVVGNPAHIPAFKARSDSAGVAQRVYFLGSQQDMSVAYQAADALAHPTLEDTFAMVVLEAMAHGLPVVVSGARHCGIAGLLTHGQQALLLDDPRDAQALARALARLRREPALVAHLRAQALEFARQHLWSALAQQQERIYRELVKA